MQQTFYIDNDEEISSVIDRLKKSLAKENYIVIPRRAIFLQSIVNLKLLKREAEKLKKKVILVTQDEMGMNMAQKAGVEVRQALDGIDHEELVGMEKDNVTEDDVVIKSHPAYLNKQVRLKEVGSNDFFQDNRKGLPMEKMIAPASVRPSVKPHIKVTGEGMGGKVFQTKFDPVKEKTLEKMFQPEAEKTADVSTQKVPVGNRTKKIFLGFVLLCVFAFAGVGIYLYVPKAVISVTLAQQEKKIDADIKASVDTQGSSTSNAEILLRIVDSADSITMTYQSSGQAEGTGGTKAVGTVVIQNSFSNSAQPLIATTRLETKDGKIFRITKNVTIPGMTTVNGEEKPGAIEVEVVADQPGEAYNIDPAIFTIPGFKDGPKYSKFSASSSKQMTGGTTSGQVKKSVTQKDIDSAKKDLAVKITEKLKQNIKQQLNKDEILLDDAFKVTVTDSKAGAKLNEIKDEFDWTISGNISAMIFSKKDVEKIIMSQYQKNPDALEVSSIRSDYAGVTPDFDKKTLTMRVHSVVDQDVPIKEEDLKKELLGKNEQEIEQLVKKYPMIKNVTFEFSPAFVSRVPQYTQRVELTIITEGK